MAVVMRKVDSERQRHAGSVMIRARALSPANLVATLFVPRLSSSSTTFQPSGLATSLPCSRTRNSSPCSSCSPTSTERRTSTLSASLRIWMPSAELSARSSIWEQMTSRDTTAASTRASGVLRSRRAARSETWLLLLLRNPPAGSFLVRLRRRPLLRSALASSSTCERNASTRPKIASNRSRLCSTICVNMCTSRMASRSRGGIHPSFQFHMRSPPLSSPPTPPAPPGPPAALCAAGRLDAAACRRAQARFCSIQWCKPSFSSFSWTANMRASAWAASADIIAMSTFASSTTAFDSSSPAPAVPPFAPPAPPTV
mmetsp:Transcript_20980/g.42238  ORF Transcript_20980/g.42238 Transcript_20980/m.42238 type:complete len:314 (-) Transcript_20980:3441-4382(-)